MMKRSVTAFLLLVLSISLLNQTVRATSIHKNLEDITTASNLIILGRVLDMASFYGVNGQIQTSVIVSSEVSIGDSAAPSSQIEVRIPGGVVGNVGMIVSDTPRFSLNQTVLLFLKKRAGYYEPVEMAQGKYTLVGDHILEKGERASEVLDKVFTTLERQKRVNFDEQRKRVNHFISDMVMQAGASEGKERDQPASDAQVSACVSPSGNKWRYPRAVYTIGSGIPSSWITPIARASSAWNQAGSVFRFSTGSSSNVISFRNFGASSSTLALTTITYDAGTGEITRSITQFNSAKSWSTTGESNKFDVQNIMTHEFGHWLHLNDIYDSGCSYVTMYGYAGTGTVYQRTLAQPDKDGIIAIYGRLLNWEFNTAGNFEGWRAINIAGSSGAAVNYGILFIDPAGSDPYVVSPTLHAYATSYRYVKLKMASNGLDPYGNVYFRTSEEDYYSADKRVEFFVNNCSACGNAPFYDYSIYMGGHSKWRGIITGIRIDPANNGQSGTNKDSMGFDYIRLTP